MLEHKIRYIEHCGQIDDFVFDFYENLTLLSRFLSSDVTAFQHDTQSIYCFIFYS